MTSPDDAGDSLKNDPRHRLEILLSHAQLDELNLEQDLSLYVTDFPASEIRNCLRARLRELDGEGVEVILRLVEVVGDESLAVELADALEAQPNLPAHRVWEILTVLQNFEVLEHRPELLEWLEACNEAIEEADFLSEDLARLMEETDDGPWLVVEGLGQMNPASREEVIGSFQDLPIGQGLLRTLEILADSLDDVTRLAARQVQDRLPRSVRNLELETRSTSRLDGNLAVATPSLLDSLVTGLNSRGRATVAFHSRRGGQHVAAAFLCDVMWGIIRVEGVSFDSLGEAKKWFADLSRDPACEFVQSADELALSLLRGSLSLGSASTPIETGYWLRVVLGEEPTARQVPAWTRPLDTKLSVVSQRDQLAKAVLEACDFWVDNSDLIYDLAEELLLRQDDIPPHPDQDQGLFRYAFEHRMRHRLEKDHRMLLWMAALWDQAGKDNLAQAALTIAEDLADAENTMPGHPFIDGIIARSLLVAQRNLKQGVDLRDEEHYLRLLNENWP